ncbi:glycosyltransferase family 2 protein [Citreimonas salinaria]|uniref:Glycosyltransferase n=1 Tax=Citreimonas salinaria TaxID=321339 RepID=A0A1H3EY14_9RHOB|nr:glycosyltransferase family 2 protein [Citreimonas salinaria]SDX83621.1 glycosyltransferase [Citreimonas salinaria]
MLKISVVTAVFNRKRTIAEALDSVASQDHPEIEHVVQDGASTDGTMDIVHARSRPSLLVQSQPDAGIYDGINRGIARTSGEVVGLMHSDDLFAHRSVLSWVAEALADPDIDGVYGDLDYVAAEDTARVIRRWRSGEYSQRKLRQGWMPPHPTLYLRRGVFDRLGLYDTSYRIAADYDAMLRYLVRGNLRLAYVPRVFVNMRMGGESNRSVAKMIQKSREDYRAIRTHGVGGVGTLALKNFGKLRQFL